MTKSRVRPITLAGLLSFLVMAPAFALGIDDLTNQDAARGIKGALTQERPPPSPSLAFPVDS